MRRIIQRDDKILATQRGYGGHKGGWEFLGGNVKPGKTPEAAPCEIAEELAMDIPPGIGQMIVS